MFPKRVHGGRAHANAYLLLISKSIIKKIGPADCHAHCPVSTPQVCTATQKSTAGRWCVPPRFIRTLVPSFPWREGRGCRRHQHRQGRRRRVSPDLAAVRAGRVFGRPLGPVLQRWPGAVFVAARRSAAARIRVARIRRSLRPIVGSRPAAPTLAATALGLPSNAN